jgi:hypothetical protein
MAQKRAVSPMMIRCNSTSRTSDLGLHRSPLHVVISYSRLQNQLRPCLIPLKSTVNSASTPYCSTLNMEAVYCSQMSASFYETKRFGSVHFDHRCQNIKSHKTQTVSPKFEFGISLQQPTDYSLRAREQISDTFKYSQCNSTACLISFLPYSFPVLLHLIE